MVRGIIKIAIILMSLAYSMQAQGSYPIKDYIPELGLLQSDVGMYVNGEKVFKGNLAQLQSYVLNEMQETNVVVTLILNGRLFYQGHISLLDQLRFHKLKVHSSILLSLIHI